MTARGPFVVGFNGPPRCGKDTIATHLSDTLDKITNLPIQRHALIAPARQASFELLGLQGGDKYYNEIKDTPLELLNGATLRDFMIAMSEKFVKHLYGTDYWARRMHQANRFWWDVVPSILIVTDIGFDAEVGYLIEHSSGYLNVVVDRRGCDYTIDSRSNVWANERGGTDFALTNDGTPQEAAEQVFGIINKLGWPIV